VGVSARGVWGRIRERRGIWRGDSRGRCGSEKKWARHSLFSSRWGERHGDLAYVFAAGTVGFVWLRGGLGVRCEGCSSRFY
jgi:hypothetical protein